MEEYFQYNLMVNLNGSPKNKSFVSLVKLGHCSGWWDKCGLSLKHTKLFAQGTYCWTMCLLPYKVLMLDYVPTAVQGTYAGQRAYCRTRYLCWTTCLLPYKVLMLDNVPTAVQGTYAGQCAYCRTRYLLLDNVPPAVQGTYAGQRAYCRKRYLCWTTCLLP